MNHQDLHNTPHSYDLETQISQDLPGEQLKRVGLVTTQMAPYS